MNKNRVISFIMVLPLVWVLSIFASTKNNTDAWTPARMLFSLSTALPIGLVGATFVLVAANRADEEYGDE